MATFGQHKHQHIQTDICTGKISKEIDKQCRNQRKKIITSQDPSMKYESRYLDCFSDNGNIPVPLYT